VLKHEEGSINGKWTKEQLLRQDYKEKEWLQVQGSNSMKEKGTAAYVIFKDEPDEKYLYIQWGGFRRYSTKL
jgi:hypothetical protein